MAAAAVAGPQLAAAAGSPSITATPSTGLVDGQQVQVVGSGFTPGDPVAVAECRAGATSPGDCYLSDRAQTTVAADGSFSLSFEVARVIQAADAAPGAPLIDCAAPAACVLGAEDLSTLAGATVPIAFDSAVAPPTPLQVAVRLSSQPLSLAADGSVTLGGTLSCNEAATVTINAQLTQHPGGASATLGSLPCTSTPSTFTLPLRPTAGVPLQPGTAQLQGVVSARSASPSVTGSATQTLSGTLDIQASPASLSVRYYLALGDSLAAGFAAPPGQGYADDLLTDERVAIPDLQLVDLAVSGATTTSFIHDGQLAGAESFLAAHPGQVALVTIDIGGNDIVGCGSRTGQAATACVQQALATIETNLATILAALRQAGGAGLPIYGMNYFDPFLIEWLTGPSGQAAAQQSVSSLLELNAAIQSVDASFGVPTADVAAAFDSTDFTDLVPSPWGVVPRNVFLVCSWLDVHCTPGGPEGFGDDANAAGYRAIANAFTNVIDLGPGPPPATVPSSGAGPPPPTLAFTGFPVALWVGAGSGLIVLGLAAFALGRRRARRQPAPPLEPR